MTAGVAGFYVLVTDITGRKRAEEERYKFQALVESSSDYIGMAEPGGNYFYLNPAGRALVGVDDDAMLLHRPGDFIAECDRQFYDERVVPALQEQGKWEGQIRLKHQKTGALIDTHRSFFLGQRSA
jgi:PAS domain S-box-containing protein